MFSGCKNLEYINLQNFDESQITASVNMFAYVPDNVVICINEDKTKTKIFPQIKKKKCYNITVRFGNSLCMTITDKTSRSAVLEVLSVFTVSGRLPYSPSSHLQI